MQENIMNKHMAILAFCASAMMGSSAFAEECYREVEVPAKQFECDSSKSSSADFTVGCRAATEKTVERVPVECGKMWVNAPAHWGVNEYKWGNICAFYGMEPADFNGVMCSSSTLQAQSGLGFESINDYQWQAAPRGTMGSYKIIATGGSYRLTGSLMSGSFCSNKPTWAQLEAQGIHASWLTAAVCRQSGKVD